MMPRSLIGLLLASSIAFAGTIYESVDKDGNVVFSDIPTPHAKALNLPPPQGFEPPQQHFPLPPVREMTEEVFSYQALKITTPENEATIRDNSGNVTVNIAVDPPLRSDDKIELLLDGAVKASDHVTAFVLQNVDRGEHKLQVRIADKDGTVLKDSEVVTFYLHRAFISPATPVTQ